MNQSSRSSQNGIVILFVGTALLVFLAWFLFRKGQSAPTSAEYQVSAGITTSVSDIEPRKQPWEEWPEPAFALLLTGEQHGFFEPCGCTSNQLGGMSRRADLAKKLKKVGWSIQGLDVGGLTRRTGAQAAIKLNTTLTALQQLGYEGVGLGSDDLKMGVDGLLDVQMQLMNADNKVRFVSANVELLGGALDEFPLRSRVTTIGGLKVGVTSILSESLKREVFPLGDAEWTEPGPALDSVLAEFEKQNVDVRVLLSQSTFKESLEFARKYPQFQIVLTARGTGDPDPDAAPQKVGETLVVEAGSQGKHAGLLGVYAEKGGISFRYKLVSLERQDFEDAKSMVDLMQEYQNRLKDERVVRVDGISAPHPSQSRFVGAKKCAECHETAHKKWKLTPHAHALESLNPVHERKGFERLNGVNRSWDPECLSCHVTGWEPQEYTRFESGFLNEEFAETDRERSLQQLLGGNQCENCHGPGSKHIDLVEAGEDDPAKSVRVSLADSKSTCEKCHDGDNSPDFVFEEYWEKVKHYEDD